MNSYELIYMEPGINHFTYDKTNNKFPINPLISKDNAANQPVREAVIINGQIAALKLVEGEAGSISDGYHTFDELYEFRKVYNAALFNEWCYIDNYDESGKELYAASKYQVHKSWKHFDEELCFGGGWFIVMAILPTGQISNHYEAKDWDLFKIPETEKANFEFDGHTSEDVLERLSKL